MNSSSTDLNPEFPQNLFQEDLERLAGVFRKLRPEWFKETITRASQ